MDIGRAIPTTMMLYRWLSAILFPVQHGPGAHSKLLSNLSLKYPQFESFPKDVTSYGDRLKIVSLRNQRLK